MPEEMDSCLERWKPVAGMIGVEFALALVNILYKKAMDEGMNHGIIVLYRQLISTIVLAPFAYLWERASWSKLTPCLVGQMFLAALLGMTLTQYLFLVGLDYTSATFTCAFINLVPVLTFLLALPLGMETARMKSRSGKAKAIGTLICVIGVLVLTLYKGMPLMGSRQGVLTSKKAKNWGLGSVLLCAGSLAWSSWFLIQTRIGQNYPHQYSSTSALSFFSALQSAVLCFCTDVNTSEWILKGNLQILTVIYAGIVAAGLCYVVMSCCVKLKGPVFTSAFTPLIQIFAAIFDVAVLHENIYLGSVLGSIIVIVGMYLLLWGKFQDEETSCVGPKTDKHATQESTIQVTSQ